MPPYILTATTLAIIGFLFVLTSAYAISFTLCIAHPPLINHSRTYLISFAIPLTITFLYLPSLATPLLNILTPLLS